MKKRFVAHSKRKFIKIKIVFLILIAIMAFWAFLSFLMNSKIKDVLSKANGDTILLSTATSSKSLKSFNLLDPKDLLGLSLNFFSDSLTKEQDNISPLLLVDPEENDYKPIVYIYNTHESEAYDSKILNAYNISYTVKTASLILKDYLNEYGIPCFVESESMSNYLHDNSLQYKDSYLASRYYIEKRKKEYNSLELFIDIHRDSVSKSATTIEIDGKSYAKAMFVVGLDHDGYDSNLALAEKFSSKLGSHISRGVLKKSGSNVNGIYNQDLSDSSLLIEVGGVDNTILEVNNTLKVLSKVIFEYLNEG